MKKNEHDEAKLAHSLKIAAQKTDISVPFWRKKIRDGEIRAKKIGRRVVVLDSDLRAFLEQQPDWTPADSGEKK
jgi:excisionase family DNA binding protein